jgi:hypothetical protein
VQWLNGTVKGAEANRNLNQIAEASSGRFATSD